MGLLLRLLAAVFVAGELWKRAVFNYVQETRRRHQLLLVRRIVMWAVALAIVGIAFATEASSFATFAGLLTAGVAVAMQSVLVSIVGYFFLIGKYGLRVGDRVQIANVTGEVIDLGIVRLHLMEIGPRDGPTGRVVAFANSVVFQAAGGIFKQIPGVSLVWRELTLTIPADADYTASKERLLLPRIACWRSTATSSSGRRARWRKRRGVPPRKRRLKCSCGSRPAQSRRSFVIPCRCSARPRSKSACRARCSTRSMRARPPAQLAAQPT